MMEVSLGLMGATPKVVSDTVVLGVPEGGEQVSAPRLDYSGAGAVEANLRDAVRVTKSPSYNITWECTECGVLCSDVSYNMPCYV